MSTLSERVFETLSQGRIGDLGLACDAVSKCCNAGVAGESMEQLALLWCQFVCKTSGLSSGQSKKLHQVSILLLENIVSHCSGGGELTLANDVHLLSRLILIVRLLCRRGEFPAEHEVAGGLPAEVAAIINMGATTDTRPTSGRQDAILTRIETAQTDSATSPFSDHAKSLFAKNKEWVKFHKIADSLMLAAVEANKISLIEEVIDDETLSDSVLVAASQTVLNIAMANQDEDRMLKRCLDAYEKLTQQMSSSDTRSNVHLLTCHSLLHDQATSVPLNCELISLLSQLFETSVHSESKWTVEDLRKDIQSPFTADKLELLLSLPLCNHLLLCVSGSYRKATLLSRQNPEEEDEDSEPILGAWYEEVLNQDCPLENDHMQLATRAILFLDSQLVSSPHMEAYLCSKLEPSHMMTLANIIKDMDSSWPLNAQYKQFSAAIQRFVHNLFAKGALCQEMQDILLTNLGINPWTQEDWPLDVSPRCLGILAQAILLHADSENIKVSVWQKMLSSLTRETTTTDLNVEHVQLMLYLFDSIPLMQRKDLLLSLIDPICDTASNRSFLSLGRILHIFEYLVKHFYAAPTWLTDQVTTNIFNGDSSMRYFACKELEENFSMQEGSNRKLKFYLLCEETQPGQFPKLDGFAVNFLFTSEYHKLYNRIIDLLHLGQMCNSSTNYVTLCSMQYCMSVSWRLFLSLHPSRQALENLSSHPLLQCVILPRLSHRNLSSWVKDGLSKQLDGGDAVKMIEDTIRKYTGMEHEITLLNGLISRLEANNWSHSELFWIEVVLGKLQHSINQTVEECDDYKRIVGSLLTRVLHLITLCRYSIHRLILQEFNCSEPAYNIVLEMSSSHSIEISSVTLGIASCLPEGLTSILNCWNSALSDTVDSWRTDFASDPLPSESLIATIANGHIGSLSKTKCLSYAIPLKRVLHFALRFANDLYAQQQSHSTEYISHLVPILLDASTESQSDFATLALQSCDYGAEMHSQVVVHSFTLMTDHITAIHSMELVFDECIKYLESVLDKPNGRQAVSQLAECRDLWAILYRACEVPSHTAYGIGVLRLYNSLWKQEELSSSLSNVKILLENIESSKLQAWLASIMASEECVDEPSLRTESSLVETFISNMVCSVRDPELDRLLFDTLCGLAEQLSTNEAAFAQVMTSLSCLANNADASWHLRLANTCNKWSKTMPDGCFASIIQYQARLVAALKSLNCLDALEKEDVSDDDSSDIYDEDSAESLSDDESAKLCTYTVTQREFMSQHWYHCHTCGMIEGVGVCSVCAKVCHKDHDVTYAKYGSFFCDCGAKGDRSCQAIEKRSLNNALASNNQRPVLGAQSSSSLDSCGSKGNSGATDSSKADLPQLAMSLAPLEKQLKETLINPVMVESVLDNVVKRIVPKLKEDSATSPVGSAMRAERALQALHLGSLNFETVDDLMLPTIGSQEGAFENVKMNPGGDQNLRQLMQSHNVRRVAMCAMTSGKRQHVAVSHEKGKITLLQLNTLLRQADSARKRLTITRLSSAPVSFTAISITPNPCNDDNLAACGLKDCHVLTFGQSGSLLNHLVLHPGLEGQNYIIKAIWLPGSQTELAVITYEFIKIYDLSKDAASPTYFFILASGNVKDVTFVNDSTERNMVVMSTNGFVYYQSLSTESMASNGSFYVTNVMQVDHPAICGSGGTSIYYSHTLQLLFMSFANSKSLMAPLTKIDGQLKNISLIQMQSKTPVTTPLASNKVATNGQPLCQWSEIPNHPGIVLAVQQFSNNPVVLMIKPKLVQIQEIRVLTAKSKISDMVSLRHQCSSGEMRTTMIVLCEDGSLRVFMASNVETNFWLSLQPSPISVVKKSKKPRKPSQPLQPVVTCVAGKPVFPVDFFEHCSQLQDIEFNGNDLLEVYNREQLKARLSSNSLYVVCTKSTGFKLHMVNNDSSMVITGVRIAVGSQDVQRVPPFVELFGRTVNITCNRTRWYDIPLTRDESLQADKKITLSFGVSNDPAFVTIIDSVKVYGKTKDSFGWPEDNEEVPTTSGTTTQQSPLEQQLENSLEMLEAGFTLASPGDALRTTALDCASQLLLLPLNSANIQSLIKALLSALHVSSNDCASHKDEALLQHVEESLSGKPDGEAFFRLTSIIKSVSTVRPENVKNMTKPQFVDLVMSHFWRLLKMSPENPMVAPVCSIGLAHVDATVHNLVDILYSLLATSNVVGHLVDMLLWPDTQVGFGAKQALIRAVKPKKSKTIEIVENAESDEEAVVTSVVDLDKKSSALVTEMMEQLDRLEEGVTCIPLLQVLLALVSQPHHVEKLVTVAVDIAAQITVECNKRTQVQYLLLKVCSILLSRKTHARTITAKKLIEANITERCYTLLESLLVYHKEFSASSESCLLKKQRHDLSNVDMLPFFQKAFVRSHAGDVFEDYKQDLTELALKLPCQIRKAVPEKANIYEKWHGILCELMMTPQAAFAKKQVRKLLMLLCGSKDIYRQVRDLHAFNVHMSAVRESWNTTSYDALIALMEHLKSCVDIAALRIPNWQKFCIMNKWVLAFLLKASFSLNEGVAPAILQLLQYAICEKEASSSLTNQLNLEIDGELIRRFLVSFLLDSNTTSIRWQAHSLVHHLYNNSPEERQAEILNMMWSLWPQLPLYGRKASQFVDLLGFFSLNQRGGENEYCKRVLNILKQQNQLIQNHPNAWIYNAVQGLVESDGYYLECEPCLVCNNPETPLASVKLSQIKVDSRFTTSSQIVKLISSQVISRMTLRIGDIKKSKMLKTVNIYYSNRTVQSVVDLRHNKNLWNRAKSCTLSSAQTELKVEFPLPIVACNLMIEFADFYENPLAASEPLQCPRCSTPVSANPGVCNNCGEQVYQCHKCRQINYDEKDPFLCNNCGFCRYAKFDFHLYCKQCCAVNPIENEEDRKKAVTYLNNQLEKADKSYTIMTSYKPILEGLLSNIYEKGEEEETPAPHSGHVNRSIQQLSQKYGNDCKATFDELSSTVQKILACRKELVEYECKQRGVPAPPQSSMSSGKCFGCVSASIEFCVTLLRAMTTMSVFSTALCEQGLIAELVEYNLRQGTARMRKDVRHLLVSLTTDNSDATQVLNKLILERVNLALKGNTTDLVSTVRHEMALLALSVAKVDKCWEDRLRNVFLVFQLKQDSDSHSVLECITLPCLKIIWEVVNSSKGNIRWGQMDTALDLTKWIEKDPRHSYDFWMKRQQRSPTEQYAFNWRRTAQGGRNDWLKKMMFNKSSRQAREVACLLTEALAEAPWCYTELIDMLTGYLDNMADAGEHGSRFMELYQSLIKNDPWKQYVVIKGLMAKISQLMIEEINKLNKLEETALTADLTQGFALKMLTEVLASLLSVDAIRQIYKTQMLGAVLDGYLCLRRLVVQRTKLVDDTQEKLLSLLEQMTTGTETETRAFLALCVETVKKFGTEDIRTPVFIFERVCNLIYPEESEAKDFQMTLEKDNQQEDFLQGRMLGNPYSSNAPGLGPLMRDIKNKICTDCELVALLEDDNGMELLVCNKIMSLDLPVKDVFKKIWCSENSADDPMRIVYRMRGLMGDATEEFIETLDSKDSVTINEEEVYKLSDVMQSCGGLEVLLERLDSLDVEKATPLLQVILKLMGLCIKIKSNRQHLVRLKCIPVLLKVLKSSLLARQSGVPEQVIGILEKVIYEALEQDSSGLEDFFAHTGTEEDLTFLLSRVNEDPSQLNSLMKIVPSLTLMNEAKMQILLNHFLPHLDFNKFDAQRSPEHELPLECFCALVQGLSSHPVHHQLRDWFVQKGILQSAIDYLNTNAPPSKSSLLIISDGWKQFVAKPSLKFILRLLAGFCRGHEASQTLMGSTIPVIHRLEQVSSEEHVGSLAENLMEVLREANSKVKKQVDDARRQTRAEKKRMAMAMREKQLGELGMTTNEKGQVTVRQGVYTQASDLGEEQGLFCIICREGYRFQPQKVLAIYTFTKRCQVEEHETSLTSRKTLGYSTVTYFNLVHVDCHVNAVRVARGREEWDSATLQNGNSKCNGLLPLWGPQVSEHSFVTALARHSTYIQDATGQHDAGHTFTVHDLKLLLNRFACGKGFSEDTGGGGHESNMHLVPYLLHLAVYTIISTRSVAREQAALTKFLALKLPKLHTNFFEADSPTYYATLALAVWPPKMWKEHRTALIKRMLQCAQARSCGPTQAEYNHEIKAIEVYKPYLLFIALVDKLYNSALVVEKESTAESWSQDLHDFIRNNDQSLSENATKVWAWMQELDKKMNSFEVYFDAIGLELASITTFVDESLRLL